MVPDSAHCHEEGHDELDGLVLVTCRRLPATFPSNDTPLASSPPVSLAAHRVRFVRRCMAPQEMTRATAILRRPTPRAGLKAQPDRRLLDRVRTDRGCERPESWRRTGSAIFIATSLPRRASSTGRWSISTA
jgi:hypothetical protein